MKPCIVLVDDDAESCRALAELLAAEGFESLPFESGEAAWLAIDSRLVRPQAVVSDIRLKGLGGVALLRRIKGHSPAIPVILVSAFADEATWAEGLRAGAFDVFPKPIQGTSLVRALLQIVGAGKASGLPVGET